MKLGNILGQSLLIGKTCIYMFQCHSPKSSHPLPLPQSPKDCSIHLCLFCCLTYRVIVTISLNSIYMRQNTVLVFFFLDYFTLHNRLQFHPPHQNGFKCVLLNGYVIFHCVFLYHSFLIHSSADGHLGCFQVLAQRQPRGMVRGGRQEGRSGWGTRVYLWRIYVDVWQNQ